jgi:hypothetical protein
MAQDTDPGVGVGDPTGSGLPSSVSPGLVPQTCVSFDRSLEILIMGNKSGAYGLKVAGQCEHLMAAYQREGWIDKLRVASAEIKRDLGAPLCAEPIYDELHPLKGRIKLRQAPVAYLGKKTYSVWNEDNLADDGEGKSVEICDTDLGGAEITEIQVSYPDAVLECYSGLQTLQAPCVTELTGSCGAGSEDGYKLWWPLYQLVDPAIDETDQSETADFLTAIKWRTVTLDSTLAVEIVGECDCGCCDNASDLTVTLEDATEGVVCIESCVTDSLCSCYDRQVRISYGTAFGYGAGIDPSLEEALVLIALVRAGDTPAKPCGCDNSMIEALLRIDPTSSTDFAHKLSYGPTVAGMSAMRIVNKALKRPHFNQPVMSGGLFSGRKVRKKGRRASFLRGF